MDRQDGLFGGFVKGWQFIPGGIDGMMDIKYAAI